MKKILTGSLALLLFMGAAQAQDTTRHHMPGHDGHEMMAKQLNLTADQQAKMKSLNEQQRNEMKALMEKYKSQRQAILTPAQREQLQKMQAEHPQRGMADKMKMDGKMHGQMHQHDKMAFQQLNLTDQQKQQMAKLREDGKQQAESIRNDKSLSDQQKKEKFEALKKQQHEKMKSVLTPEQQEKLKSMKKDRPARNSK